MGSNLKFELACIFYQNLNDRHTILGSFKEEIIVNILETAKVRQE